MATLTPGDFTPLATAYVNRPGYSEHVLWCLGRYIGAHRPDFKVADVGAGTGKLTEGLVALGLSGYAVEPNEAMFGEGSRLSTGRNGFQWLRGRAEATGLPDSCVDWVTMASSFHWTDAPAALAEFHRILRPGGFFTAMWNPRDLENDPLQKRIDDMIKARVPNLRRVSSAAGDLMKDLERTLQRGGLFGDLLFVEAPHAERMSRERYMGIWASVNDIPSQAGPERWRDIVEAIEAEIVVDELVVRYRTRSWTVQAKRR